MKKFSIFSVSVLLVGTMLFSSCKDEVLQKEQQKSVQRAPSDKLKDEIRGYIIPLNKALEELSLTLAFLDEANELENNFSSRKKKENVIFLTKNSPVFSILKENDLVNDTVLYVVEFENDNGFVILSADYRYMPIVIAVIEYGNFADFCKLGDVYENEMNKGIDKLEDMWVGMMSGKFGIGNGMEDWIDLMTRRPDLNGNIILEGAWNPIDSVAYVGTVLKDFVKPMLTTLWYQGSPFNDECPTRCRPTENAPAGCVAIAVGQIVAYHEYPKTIDGYSYDYKGMKRVSAISSSTPPTNSDKAEVAKFIRKIGSLCLTTYGCSSSSSTLTFARNCLDNKLKYPGVDRFAQVSDGKGTWYTWSSAYEKKTIEALKRNCPVLVCAAEKNLKGHAWVIDGYAMKQSKYIIYRRYTTVEETNTLGGFYLHCNFGWEGIGNGYYIGNIFDTGNSEKLDDEELIDSNPSRFDWGFGIVTTNKP